MIKTLTIVSRHPEITREHFVERWTGHHADLVRQTPGMARYVQNLTDLDRVGAARGYDRGEIDGIAEFWYADGAAMAAAHASDQWREVIEDAGALLGSVTSLGVTEIVVIADKRRETTLS